MFRLGRFVVLSLVGIGFILGLLVGASARPEPEQPPGVQPTRAPSSSTPPAESTPTAPHSAPDDGGSSRQGAVATAARIVTQVDGPAIFDQTQREELLSSVAASGSEARLLASVTEVSDVIVQQLGLTPDVLAHDGFVWRPVPVGWRLDSFGDGRAQVAVWGTGVVAIEGRQLDQPGWQTIELHLQWERDAWRLVRMSAQPGPTPPLAGAPDSGEVGRLIDSFEPFVLSATGPQEGS